MSSGNLGGSGKTLRDVRGLFGELGRAGNHAACCRGNDQPDRHMDGTALWKARTAHREQYNLNLVKGLNDVAVGLAEQNQPLAHPFRQSFQWGGYD